MSDFEASQARPATPPMTTHHGAVILPGREFRPEPLWSEDDELRQEIVLRNGNDGLHYEVTE